MLGEALILNFIISLLASLLAATIVAVIAYVFRVKIKKIFFNSTLKSKENLPSLSLEIDGYQSHHDKWVTSFLIENTGNIDVTKLRIFLCSYNFTPRHLSIESIKIKHQDKRIYDAGQRLQINTLSLHKGCNLTEDQRYFVEFVDSKDGLIYRMAKGAPSARDGNMPLHGTVVCRKRLPVKGLSASGEEEVVEAMKKYDIDLVMG